MIAIALITKVEDLNTGTSFNANVCALSQVQKKQLQNLTIPGSIQNLVNGFQDHNHVLPAITGTLIQNLACASDKHAQPHTHGLMKLANASAILLLLDQPLTLRNKFAMDALHTNGTNLPATANFVTIKNAQTTPNLECPNSGTPTAANANASPTRSVESVNTSTSNHATAKLFELFVIILIAPLLNFRRICIHIYIHTLPQKISAVSFKFFIHCS